MSQIAQQWYFIRITQRSSNIFFVFEFFLTNLPKVRKIETYSNHWNENPVNLMNSSAIRDAHIEILLYNSSVNRIDSVMRRNINRYLSVRHKRPYVFQLQRCKKKVFPHQWTWSALQWDRIRQLSLISCPQNVHTQLRKAKSYLWIMLSVLMCYHFIS